MEKVVSWIEFPGTSAVMRLATLPPGGNGRSRFAMILTPGDDPPGGLAAAAEGFGFTPLPGGRNWRYYGQAGRRLPKNTDLVEALPGAISVGVPQAEMYASDRFVDLRRQQARRRPRREAAADDGQQPNRKDLEELGRNHHGDLVVRDREGRFYRVTGEGERNPRYVMEKPTDPGPLFLRAARGARCRRSRGRAAEGNDARRQPSHVGRRYRQAGGSGPRPRRT